MKRNIAIVSLTLVVIGLGYALYAHNSRLKLEPVHAAAAEIRGALDVGTSYVTYIQHVQALSSAILRAKEAGASPASLESYSTALDDYKDVLTLWGNKIERPYCYGLGEYGTGQYDPLLVDMAAKYAVSGKVSDNGPENLRTYNAVIQEIWSRAGQALGKGGSL